MATATQSRGQNRITSPFALDDVNEAYKAYCNAPFSKSPTFTKPSKPQFRKMYADRHEAAKAKEQAKTRQSRNTSRSNTRNTAPVSTTVPANGNSPAGGVNLMEYDAETAAIIAEALGIENPHDQIEDDEPEQGIDLNSIIANLVAAKATPQVIADTVLALQGQQGSTTSTTQPSVGNQYRARTPRSQVPADAARNAVLWALNTEGYLQIVPEGGCDPIMQDDGTDLLSEVFGPLPDNRTQR